MYCKYYTSKIQPTKGFWNLVIHGCMKYFQGKTDVITGVTEKECGSCEVLNKNLACDGFEEK
jgi:cystathionine beta-lyase/cystathionine gamma-synthase